MDLDKITAEQFDRVARRLQEEYPEEMTAVELSAVSRMAEESMIGGLAAKQGSETLGRSHGELWRRQVFASTFFFGVRFGWHLRRMMAQEEILNGMLSPEEEIRLRREIQKVQA